MHELSITEHLLADCIRNAEAQNASKIPGHPPVYRPAPGHCSGLHSDLSGYAF